MNSGWFDSNHMKKVSALEEFVPLWNTSLWMNHYAQNFVPYEFEFIDVGLYRATLILVESWTTKSPSDIAFWRRENV